MNRLSSPFQFATRWALVSLGVALCFVTTAKIGSVSAKQGESTHIGTFEGSTTFTTSSSNGINPGLFIEVMDEKGNLKQYESEEGVVTIPDTREGTYVTQAKFLGKTKYVDEDSGEILDKWEEGRNLSLISVENPILTTTGKNLFNDGQVKSSTSFGMTLSNNNGKLILSGTPTRSYGSHNLGLKLESGKTYSFQVFINGEPHTGIGFKLWGWDKDGKLLVNRFSGETFTTSCEVSLSFVWENLTEGAKTTIENITIQIEENSQATTYKPYQSSTLTVNEQLTLRGIGSVRDELDLMTGEMMRRIGEYLLDGNDNENWTLNTTYDINETYVKFILRNVPSDMALKNSLSHWLTNCFKNQLRVIGVPNEEGISSEGNMHAPLMITIKRDKLTESTPKGFKLWLSQSPVTIQYTLLTSDKRSVRLASNYYFQPTLNQSIQVNGEITPVVASITVPTDSLSFTIDPNQAAGQQFIAPDFTLRNETLAPLRLELKAFEQVTNVLKDVLPDTYESWEGLNQVQSKDIALALVPKPSDQWLSLIEGPRYVADTSSDLIGTIKGQSTVEFSFEALHGRAFSEVLAPRYQLTFIFEVN